MPRFSKQKISDAVTALKSGGVGVLPTDTIYGIVGSAFDKKAVARIYRLRRRNLKKPMIILIANINDLGLFGIKPNTTLVRKLKKFWPGKVSLVLPIPQNPTLSDRFKYLHRGGETLAFRLPKPVWLREFLKETGPLVAPSANIEGKSPAKTILEAKLYFGNKVHFYLSIGPLKSPPSMVLKLEKGKIIVLRK